MKSNFFEKYYSGNFFLMYFIIIMCSCTIIKSVKYKTMVLTVNSKSYLNSREKMNKMLEKYKIEITKLKEINNKINFLSTSLLLSSKERYHNNDKKISNNQIKIQDKNINRNNVSNNNSTYIKSLSPNDKIDFPKNSNVTDSIVNQTNNKDIPLDQISDFLVSLEINLLNEIFIEKFNLTTQKFDWKKNSIKLPEFSKDSICYIDTSKNDTEKYNKSTKNQKMNINITKSNSSVISTNNKPQTNRLLEYPFLSINFLKSPFAKNLKLSKDLSNKKTIGNSNSDNNIKRISFIKISEQEKTEDKFFDFGKILNVTFTKNKTMKSEQNTETDISAEDKSHEKTIGEINQIIKSDENLIHLSNPEPFEINRVLEFFKQINQNYKDKICHNCLDHSGFLQDLKSKISLAIQEIKTILQKPIRKSELVEYFSDKINKVNLIKLTLENLKEVLKLQKEFSCIEYENMSKFYEASSKAANSLVEAIQNSIRRHNLNISFLVIS